MLTKDVLMQQVKNLPKEFTIDQLVEKLIIIEKINIGLNDSKLDVIKTDDEMDEIVSKWYK